MVARLVWLLLFAEGLLCYEVDQSDWYLEEGQFQKMESLNYPQDAPGDLRQSWEVTAPEGHVLSLEYTDIRLFQMTPCGDYVFTVEDSRGKQEICGAHFDFKFVSSGSWLKAELKTGEWARGFVSCLVRAAKEGEEQAVGGEERPQEAPKPAPEVEDPHAFLDWASEEVDSSEHGGPQGKKNTTCPCGMANKDQTRMFGGRETKVNEFPFVAGVGYRGTRRMFCGASLVTPWHALTAAHCTYGEDAAFDLILAEHDTFSDSDTNATRIVPVRMILEHERYNPDTFHNDIALVVTDEEIKFNKYISPICLPNGFIDLEMQYIKIIGWGRTEVTGRYMSSVLRKVDLRVLPKKTCHLLRPQLIPPGSPSQTCVYGHQKSACSGDSGGPLAWVDPETNRYTLVGLVSYGTSDCGTTTPRVSTDLTAFVGWVQQRIAETYPGAPICSKIE